MNLVQSKTSKAIQLMQSRFKYFRQALE